MVRRLGGVPAVLSGDQIPISGRIVAVAEFAIESTTTDKVRAAWDLDRLADELKARRGSQFAPAVADTALDVLPELTTSLTPAS